MKLKKIKEISAGSVLFYKNKVLLLYDHNKKCFDQSQGHPEKGESLPEAALREAREETGFQNLKLIKKLGKYQYHFKQTQKIVYKIIHVYLIEILNLKKSKNTQLLHENYSSHFFTFKKALKLLKWQQDKRFIKLAQAEILKYQKSPN